ncbi:uncharacterized protein QC763_507660 [Podospora pseudopauciseta]|uniref:Actin n=1 Tax=Podospora pseudopauciseta TaxID=2093780 RepID=A0ABR0H9V0_9PEZI|nr:hypothetical protein QC763_507660 [Podospora pseudopauciseta]
MDMEDTAPAIVIDTGSLIMKAGFAGDEYPTTVFPSVVGRPKDHKTSADVCGKENYVGDEAQSKRGILELRYPIEQGVITDWQDVEAIWHHALYHELRVEPHEHPILMEHALFTPDTSKEKMTQIIFETFNVPAFYVALNPSLALYGMGRTTGLVVESGDSVTHAVPLVHGGHEGLGVPVRDAIRRLDLGGRHITDYMIKLLRESGHNFVPTTSEHEVVENIKHLRCYTAFDFENETRLWVERESDPTFQLHEISHELPDGQVINLTNERFRGPEAMFRPSVLGLESGGIHALVCDAIMKCDSSIQKELFGSIFLAGGNMMFSGLANRLQKEIVEMAPSYMSVKVVVSPGMKYLTWVGGSVLASLSTFEDMCISSQEYDEMGPSGVHRKCLA